MATRLKEDGASRGRQSRSDERVARSRGEAVPHASVEQPSHSGGAEGESAREHLLLGQRRVALGGERWELRLVQPKLLKECFLGEARG